jgi:hypothetical protein
VSGQVKFQVMSSSVSVCMCLLREVKRDVPYVCFLVVYYESIKSELKRRPIYECRCDERLKTKPEKSTRLGYTGLLGELEHLQIKTRLIDEMFGSVMDEYVFLK